MGSPPPPHTATHRAMGTTFQVMIAGLDARPAQQAAEAAFELLDRLEEALSHHRPESDVCAINRLPAGKSLTVSIPVFECLTEARRLHQETGGAFDPTLGALLACWRTRDGLARFPSPTELAAARQCSGMEKLVLHPTGLRVETRVSGLEINLGGIGKGFAVDRMVALLEEWGVESMLVHGGRSSVRARGAPPGQAGWPVTLPDPIEPDRTPGSLCLADCALGASGTAFQGLHVLDPRTGRPAERYLASRVRAPTALEADALSTAFLALPPEAVTRCCRRLPGVAALLVERSPEPGSRRRSTTGDHVGARIHRLGGW